MYELCPSEHQNRILSPQIAGITKKQKVLKNMMVEKNHEMEPFEI